MVLILLLMLVVLRRLLLLLLLHRLLGRLNLFAIHAIVQAS
jgi:hypothetical protein